MSARDDLISMLKREKASLQQQLEMLQSAKLWTGEKRTAGGQWIDTTPETILRIEGQLEEIDSILARYPDSA